MILSILLFFAVYFAIWSTTVNIARTIYQNNIPRLNFIIMSLSYTFIVFYILNKLHLL